MLLLRTTTSLCLTLLLLGAGFACGPAAVFPDGAPADGPLLLPDALDLCGDTQYVVLTGTVTAPNGIDPVHGAMVYIPDGDVVPFPDGLSCDLCSELTGPARAAATTRTDGTFALGPIPTQGLPLGTVTIATQIGRFRRVAQVSVAQSCGSVPLAPGDTRLPGMTNEPAEHVPRIAIATGDYDAMECVLLRLGLNASAFDLYEGRLFADPIEPAVVDTFDNLLLDPTKMAEYNIIFINCTSDTYEALLLDSVVKTNIENYVASGGRLYVTDWSYDYIEQVPEFAPIIDFEPGPSNGNPEPMNAGALGPGGIFVQASVKVPALAEWLEAVERAAQEEIISASRTVQIEDFLDGWVEQLGIAPEYNATVWLEGNVDGRLRPLTTTFEHNQCGRTLYTSYHTRGRDAFIEFPYYCPTGSLLPQERVLEYLILDISRCVVVE